MSSDALAVVAAVGHAVGGVAGAFVETHPGAVANLVVAVVVAVATVDGVHPRFVTPWPWLTNLLALAAPKVGEFVEAKITEKLRKP